MAADGNGKQATLFGHPAGLYTLFFAEMWERFSYYGMRALLLFYMLKGFLRYDDPRAYAAYGAYTSLVYMTPFFGGLLADRLLGARRAVVIGGLLMAAGHLLMTVEDDLAFFTALGLLISGNGFFKPNISTMVGTLYEAGSRRRDGGFTLFYMGINLGATLSPLLCGYVGETYGWHYGFGLATIGMLIGVSVFVTPVRVTQALILGGGLSTSVSLLVFRPDNPWAFGVNVLAAATLSIAAVVATIALARGGIPPEAGAPPDPERLVRRVRGGLRADVTTYLGAVLMVPVFALLVSGFSPFTKNRTPLVLLSDDLVNSLAQSGSAVVRVLGVVAAEVSKPAGLVLALTGVFALAYIMKNARTLAPVERDRLRVVVILTFVSMLFWAFFEQAGSSINNFTDRNVDRVGERAHVTPADVGTRLMLEPTQEQVGYTNGDHVFTLTDLDRFREKRAPDAKLEWAVGADNVGMGIAHRADEVPASLFQAANPVFILTFGLLFTFVWTTLGKRNRDPSAGVKFALGLAQLAAGFGLYWYGAQTADARGMVAVSWLLLGYLLLTTGELCLSPVGLSMVTRLSPKVLVSTMMGTWFLATAFSQYLAGIISQFTGVSEGGTALPLPRETVGVYGGVFGKIAVFAFVSALACLALAPTLKRWEHQPKAP
jgi:proton-dependent oligopeptide transporter, POT family